MTDTAEIVSALRFNDNCGKGWLLEAATALEALQAERDRVVKYLSDAGYETVQSEMAWKARAEAAEARLKEAIGLLEPFADCVNDQGFVRDHYGPQDYKDAKDFLDRVGTVPETWCTFCKKSHPGGNTCMGHYP